MANPSLQIGNSKWAIKKDNLLGYSTAGTRFLPIPITMTRASAGTRVNPQGLVETVELLGSEEITNGNFATNTDWTLSQTTIANDKATVNSTSAYGIKLTQATTIGLNKTYKLLFTVADVGANINFKIGFGNLNNGVYSDLITTAGTYEIYLTQTDALAPSQILILTWSIAVQTFSITNISVKESTRNDLARVDYTGSTSSLLAEPQRTNLVIYSEDFSNAAWSKSSVGIDTSIGTNGINPNIAISPDGTLNSDRVNFLLQSDRDSGMYEIISASTGNSYTTSVYLKGEGSNIGKTIKIRIKRVTGGSFVSVDADYVLTGEWVRLEMNPLTLSGANSNALLVFTSNDATSCLMYGCQVEEGSYPTSIIPTSGSTVTRNQDQFTRDGIGSLINSTEGVLFLEMAALADDGTNRYLSISNSTVPADDYIYFRFMSTSNRVLARTRVGGVTINTMEKTISDTTAYNKYAIKWKSGDYAFWINGVEELVDTSATIFGADVLNQIKFDFPVGSGTFPSKVKQLQVYKTALTDEQLIQLTGTSGTDFYESYAEMASALTYTIQ